MLEQGEHDRPRAHAVNAVHVAADTGDALGVSQAPLAVEEVAEGPVGKCPGMMAAGPGHDLWLHRQS